MRSDRVAAALSGATIFVVLAVAPDVSSALPAVLLVVVVAVVFATLAPALPLLHRLPAVGAPGVALVLTLEKRAAEETGPRPAIRLLRVGIRNEGPGELRRPRLNVLVPFPITLHPGDGFGQLQEHRGEEMPNTSEPLVANHETAFWAERLDTIDEDSVLAHYLLYGTPAGAWRVRVRLASTSLDRKRELVQEISFDAAREGASQPS